MGINPDPIGWNATGFTLGSPTAPFPWTPGTRHSPSNIAWPPLGLQVAIHLQAPASAPPAHQAVSITLVYEMYPGIPLLTKWATINSTGPAAAGVVITGIVTEALRLNEPYASPIADDVSGTFLYVQTDQAHSTTVQNQIDSASPADPGATELLLIANYSSGPGVILSGGSPLAADGVHRTRYHRTLIGSEGVAEFVSFRTFELVTDTNDPERFGLSVRRLTRLWAPHVLENPIFFHATATDTVGFQTEIDQMAAVGFEMLIYSFGTDFNFEDTDPTYLAQVQAQIAYAKAQGIEVGGYDLICLDRGNGGYGGNVGDQWDAVADDGSGALKADACFASGWVDKLDTYVDAFLGIGLTMVETDGPYGGGDCASTNHSHHLQLSDSVYQQTQVQANFYVNLRAKNIFINQPDNYFFQGGQKTGMGYNEDQYSLPRWQDVTVSRQSVYDDTFWKVPTQGWMFVPLVDYHGGGADAAFDPMSEHLPEYEMALAQYLGAGVAACYRGFRLFDSPAAQAVVAKWVAIYKALSRHCH